MKRQGTWLIAGLTLLVGMGSNWHRPVTRPPCLPGIPQRDYKLIDPVLPTDPPVQAISFKGNDILGPDDKSRLRVFPMGQKALTVLHCSIAQVAFTYDKEGNWIFNCQADQNPWFSTMANSLPPSRLSGVLKNLETNHLLRNEFTVTVRCYGNYDLKEDLKTTGKPALATIPLKTFMVQRGVPLMVTQKSDSPVAALRDNYANIDRVAFELGMR